MKFFKVLLIPALLILFSTDLEAQIKARTSGKSTATGGGFKRLIRKTPWTFGLSGHVVDDDGNPFKNLFNVNKSWNFLSYPVRLTVDGYYQAGFSFQAEFAYTQYKVGKLINNEVNGKTGTFFSSDVHVKYDLNEVFGPTNWFDPYVAGGYGFTLRSVAKKPMTATFNMGLGFNIWVYENLGFNLQSMAKFAMIEGTSNYLHHSVGIVYKLEGGQGSRPGRLGKRYKFVGKSTKR